MTQSGSEGFLGWIWGSIGKVFMDILLATRSMHSNPRVSHLCLAIVPQQRNCPGEIDI